MRPAYSILGWFLALTLFSLGACNPLFLIPACEYDPRFAFCQPLPGSDMESKEGLADHPADMSRPPMKSPTSFTMVAQSPLSATRKWVGIRSSNLVLFAKQMPGVLTAEIEHYQLAPSLSQATGWDLKSAACSDCPVRIQNVNFANKDFILASYSMFFVVKSDYAFSVDSNGLLVYPTLNVGDNKTSTKFRPFISSGFDIISYQRNSPQGNLSDVYFFTVGKNKTLLSLASRSYVPATTYYAIGDLDGSGTDVSDNEILIFEENSLHGAFRINKSLTSEIADEELAMEIRKSIIDAHPADPQSLIRTGFIVDLNRDGYMELVYARRQQVFATTFNPHKEPGFRFENWPQPIMTIDADHTVTLSAADLNGDGYPELAIETRSPSDEPLAVSFYLNSGN